MKSCYLIFFLILLTLGIQFYPSSPYNFLSCSQFDSRFDCSNQIKKEDLQQILSQPFRYLGNGYQSIVFVSEDQLFVIKFAKRSRFRLHPLLQIILPRESLTQKLANKQKLLMQYISSNQIGYENLKNECGFVYAHINPTDDLNLSVTLQDRFFRKHSIDLDQKVFFVQKKMKPFAELLNEYHQAKDTEQMKILIGQLIDQVFHTMQQGLIDTDRSYYKNYGILDHSLACFDTGNLRKNFNLYEPAYLSIHLHKYLTKTRRWIKKNYPEELAFFDEKESSIINNLDTCHY